MKLIFAPLFFWESGCRFVNALLISFSGWSVFHWFLCWLAAKSFVVANSVKSLTASALKFIQTRGVQPFWSEVQVYKFQTSRGPDRDAEGVEGRREWEGVSPSPVDCGALGSIGVGRKRVLAYFRAWKNTPDGHKPYSCITMEGFY